jgi:hypothetical protein
MQEKTLLNQKLAHTTFTQVILEAFPTIFLVHHTKNQALYNYLKVLKKLVP